MIAHALEFDPVPILKMLRLWNLITRFTLVLYSFIIGYLFLLINQLTKLPFPPTDYVIVQRFPTQWSSFSVESRNNWNLTYKYMFVFLFVFLNNITISTENILTENEFASRISRKIQINFEFRDRFPHDIFRMWFCFFYFVLFEKKCAETNCV